MTIQREQMESADWSSASTGERLAAVHPGEVLAEDFLKPLGLLQYRLAKDIGVPALRISQIVRGRRARHRLEAGAMTRRGALRDLLLP